MRKVQLAYCQNHEITASLHAMGDPAQGRTRNLAWLFGAIVAVCLLAAAIFAYDRYLAGGRDDANTGDLPSENASGRAGLAGDDETSLRDLSENEALTENVLLPFSTEPLETALALDLSEYVENPLFRRRATDCLTSAIYYEAGFQSAHERRAVAQVVLNRVRHPAYPPTVCDVVYEGSGRRTGCQFTFTCDGSELREPRRWAWDQAREIASAALSGTVEPSVGMATHYHADYVQPYWAANLAKIEKVGRHYFYRFPGSWGRRSAYRQRPLPDFLIEEQVIDDAVQDAPLVTNIQTPVAPSPVLADSLGSIEPSANALIEEPQASSGLLADEKAGKLIEGEKSPLD